MLHSKVHEPFSFLKTGPIALGIKGVADFDRSQPIAVKAAKILCAVPDYFDLYEL